MANQPTITDHSSPGLSGRRQSTIARPRREMRVVATAYACEPDTGSETGIGWNIAREVGRRIDNLVVITRNNNRDAIEAALADDPEPGLEFVYYDLPKWAGWWKRGKRGLQAYYYLWQIGAARLAAKMHSKKAFDASHHITFGRYWSPTFLPKLGIPLVWGPVGGGESAPSGFWPDFPLGDKAYEYMRLAARATGEFDPFVRRAARKCAVGLPTTSETETRMRKLGVNNTRILGNAALGQVDFAKLATCAPPPEGDVRFASIGRLLNWKGFAMGLQAFAETKRHGSEYWIIGDGPDRERLQSLAAELDIENCVRFTGSLTREETFEALEKTHVLVHPSLHDSGGWVCIETMAAGRPVICLDLGGPAILVDDECGFKINAQGTAGAIDGLARAMQTVIDDPSMIRRLGIAARHKAATYFTWESKADEIVDAYEYALHQFGATQTYQA